MTLAQARRRLWSAVFMLLIGACGFDGSGGGCGDSIISNYRFDRWCGDELCNWVTLTGPESIRRAPTWHDNDYGVELLATPTVITQKRYISGVECLEFEMIADIEPGADVEVGLDYNFDGDPSDPANEADVSINVEVDDSIVLPSAKWQKLTFLFPTPVSYNGVRFVIRKRGVGRSVIAEVRAQSSDKCTAPRPELENLPLGIPCDALNTCASGICASTTPKQALIDVCEEISPEEDCEQVWNQGVFGEGFGACSECSQDAECPGQVCGLVDGARGPFRSCTNPGNLGARCTDDHHCLSGRCNPLPIFSASWLLVDSGTCGECVSDLDCPNGEICGLDPGAPARVCQVPAEKPLSTLCEVDAECRSGICCFGRCSECCETGTDACSADCATLFETRDEQRFETPRVCLTRAAQESGAECLGANDCISGVCDGTQDVCTDDQRCLGSQCQEHMSNACDTFITIAGTCQ